MQDTVHLLVPYIQRFLWHHDELAHVYAELLERNIGERLKELSFVQVSSLVDVFKPFLSRHDGPAHFLRSAPFHAVTVKSQIHCFLILTCLFLVPPPFTKVCAKHTVVKRKVTQRFSSGRKLGG